MKSSIRNRIRRALSLSGFRARVLVAVALAGPIISACDVHGISAPGTLASIIVTPNATLVAGTTQQMTAVGYDAGGIVVPLSPTWTVAAAGGTINSTGLFTAGATPGLYRNTVVASVGSISGSASITVIPGALATIIVTPNPVTLAVTGTQQFIAVGKDAAGNIVAFTPTWSVVASGGSITQAGVFTAGGVIGTYTNTVQASTQGITAYATVNVTAGPLASLTVTPNPVTLIVGATQQFVAVGKDASGNILTIAAVWSVVNGGGTVDGGGIFTAGAAPGTFANTVKATSGTLAGTATVVVTAGPLAIITVTPNPATMAISGTQQFAAVGSDIAGNPVVITPVWTVVLNGGTINATGLFTAGTVPGTFTNTVRASSGGLSGVATVIVTSGPLANITVTPNPVFMLTNSLQQFLAVGRDASGNVFVMKPVWSVVNGGGVIDTLGNFTSGALLGTFNNTIKATSGAISGFATVNVGAGPLATITVTPNPSNLNTGGTQTFTAVGKDAGGNVMVIAPAWSVVNATAGSINGGTGLFTAGAVAGTYTNTVQATSGAISGFATVVVAAPFVPLVNFGTAAINGIMAGASVTCSGTGVIQATSGTANISISPGSTITGFVSIDGGPCVFSGTTHLGDPTALADQGILTAAYNTLAGQPCPAANNFGTIDLNGKTLPAGVYCSGTSQLVTGTLTLNGGGDPNATFVFQAGSTLTGAANIVLIGNAQAKNVYWQVGSSATLNASAWQGNIVALTSISLNVNSTLLGRALARNGSVTMDASHNVITLP